jgi:hypothetical protein
VGLGSAEETKQGSRSRGLMTAGARVKSCRWVGVIHTQLLICEFRGDRELDREARDLVHQATTERAGLVGEQAE